MKIAIHHRATSFSERWIAYCEKEKLDFEVVDVYRNDIISYFKEKKFTHFLWHMSHSQFNDLRLFPYVMNSLEEIGVKCFPNFNTRWHFDDKIAQKYLLEAIGAPLVKSFVFYTKESAFQHVKEVTFPIVVKLSRGAGSTNVKLIHNINEAHHYIEQMFSTGLNTNSDTISSLTRKSRIAKKYKNPFKLIKKVYEHLTKHNKEQAITQKEKGYFYYQEFIPNNDHDIRILVVDNKAFAIKRIVRKGDFKASGSGLIDYAMESIDPRCVAIAFEISKRLNCQSIGFDFVFDKDNTPLIVEMGFGFNVHVYDACPGYWTEDLQWTSAEFNPQEWMLKALISKN